MCICKICNKEIEIDDEYKYYSLDEDTDYKVHDYCLDNLADSFYEQQTIEFLTYDF